MLLVDEAEIDENGLAHCKYTIKEDEFFTRGHFPGNPIVPGVIQCEIMAQSCAIMVKEDIPGHLTFCAAKLEVGGKLCCKGELTFALIPKE